MADAALAIVDLMLTFQMNEKASAILLAATCKLVGESMLHKYPGKVVELAEKHAKQMMEHSGVRF